MARTLGVGLRFCATEEELIQLLKMKAQGKDITRITRGFVLQKTLYGRGKDKLPWNVFTHEDEGKWRLYDNLGQNTGKNESKRIIYVVTKVSRMSAKKVQRSAGFGTWDGQTKPEPIKNSQGIEIGAMKSLNYHIESGYESEAANKGYWYLHEYSLSKESLREIELQSTDYVICRIIMDMAKTSKVKSSKVDNKTERADGGGDSGGFGDDIHDGSHDENPNPPGYNSGFGNNCGMDTQNGYAGTIYPKKEAPACYVENQCFTDFSAGNQIGMNYGFAMNNEYGCTSGSIIPLPEASLPSYVENQCFNPIRFTGFQCNYVGDQLKADYRATSALAPMDVGCSDQPMGIRFGGSFYVEDGTKRHCDSASTSAAKGNNNLKLYTNDNVIENQSSCAASTDMMNNDDKYNGDDEIPPLLRGDDENFDMDELLMNGSNNLAQTDKDVKNSIDRMSGSEPYFKNAFGGMFGEQERKNIEEGTSEEPKVRKGHEFPQSSYP